MPVARNHHVLDDALFAICQFDFHLFAYAGALVAFIARFLGAFAGRFLADIAYLGFRRLATAGACVAGLANFRGQWLAIPFGVGE